MEAGDCAHRTPASCTCPSVLLASQTLEAEEARLARRAEELALVERRIASAQQRLDGEAERLKTAMAAVEEEGAALKASAAVGGHGILHCMCSCSFLQART